MERQPGKTYFVLQRGMGGVRTTVALPPKRRLKAPRQRELPGFNGGGGRRFNGERDASGDGKDRNGDRGRRG